MYHTQAPRTLGALVDRKVGGRTMGKAISAQRKSQRPACPSGEGIMLPIYDDPNITKRIETAICTDRRVRSALDAWATAAFEGPLTGPFFDEESGDRLDSRREKKTLRVSSRG